MQNVIEVKAPMELSEIKSHLENPETIFLIDYKNSELRENMFLTYLSNLDLPSLVNMSECSFEQKEGLLLSYMRTRMVYNSPCLMATIAQILLAKRDVLSENMIKNPWFNAEEIKTILTNHSDIFDRWEHFLESSILYAMGCVFDEDEKEVFKSELTIEKSRDYVGVNVVHIFSLAGFYEAFLSIPSKHEITYFEPYFEEYMFKGNNLFHYFRNENNLVLGMLLMHVNGNVGLEQIQRIDHALNKG